MNVIDSGAEFSDRTAQFVPVSALRSGQPGRFLWHGYLVPGQIALLTGQWKVGKTTLVSLLLARMSAGGTLAGRSVSPGRAVVLSEESGALWADRHARLNFGPSIRIAQQPFRGRPTEEEWRAMLDQIVALERREGLDLVVIDSLAAFVPGPESDTRIALDLLHDLRRLTALGVCILILHHPRKAKSEAGKRARGCAALTESVDVTLELDYFDRPESIDPRRRLWAFSSYDETPPRHLIELTPDGTDYRSLGEFAASDAEPDLAELFRVLEGSARELTVPEILSAWPSEAQRPHAATLWKWLERAVRAGRVLRSGAGRRNQPYRYWVLR